MTTLGSAFNRKRNGLNLLRLLLAAGVIVWHSFPLTGHTLTIGPLRQLLSNISVDGFFAISGFLIAGSWLNRPKVGSFLRARALRLLPGFYICLLFTAFVLAPLVVRLATGAWLPAVASARYVKADAFVWITAYDIGGTPTGVPYPHAWNGSLWTLAWEGLCYLGVATVGVIGLLRSRWLPVALFAAMLAVSAAVTPSVTHYELISDGARFGLMFAAGMTMYLWADRIPVSRPVAAGAVVILLGSSFLPDYRLLAALPIAYLLIVAGSRIRSPRLQFRNDISYGVYIYAFPVQQSLALFGLWRPGVPLFAALSIAATVPFAAASWFGVERWALRLKRNVSNRDDACAVEVVQSSA